MVQAAQERVSYLEGKMDEMSNTLTRIERLLTSLDRKVDRRFDSSFVWIFGVQVTTLLTLVAGLFTIIAKLL